MANSKGSFIWYELMSPDPVGSKAFYDAVVGWDIDTDQIAPGVDYRMLSRRDGSSAGGMLTLTDTMIEGGAKPMWLGYVHAEDVDASVAAIVADGGAVLIEPRDEPGVGRMALIAGPEGAPMYLLDPLPPEGEDGNGLDVFSVDQPEHFRWNELSSDDPPRSIDFYKRHFGWGQEGGMDMGEIGKYQFIQAGEVTIGAIMPRMPGTPASLWTLYIGVDDIDRAAKAVEAGGGKIVNGPMEVPGGEFAMNAIDPQGALVGLVGPRRNQGASA